MAARSGRIDPSWGTAIADPVRLELLGELAMAEKTSMADLVAAIGASEATVRRHLDALVRSGLVRAAR